MEVNKKDYTVAHIASLIRRRNVESEVERCKRKLIITNNTSSTKYSFNDHDIDCLDVQSLSDINLTQLLYYQSIYFVYDDDFISHADYKNNLKELAEFMTYIPFYSLLYIFAKSDNYAISKSDAHDRIDTINEINEILDRSNFTNPLSVQQNDWSEFWLSTELNK